MIPVQSIIVGGYSAPRRYIDTCNKKRVLDDIRRLRRSDIKKIFSELYTGQPLWVYKRCLFYVWKYQIHARVFLQYFDSLDPNDYIKGQFDHWMDCPPIRDKRSRFKASKENQYKAAYGIHWKKYWKNRPKRWTYSAEIIAEKNGIKLSEAKAIVAQRKKRTAGTFENFLRRANGDVKLAKKRFNVFRQKSAHTSDKFKTKYGSAWKKKWDAYRKSKNNYDFEKYVERYGLKLAKVKFEERIQLSRVTYEKYVELYGDKAEEKYTDYCQRKTENWKRASCNGGATKQSLHLFKPVMRWLDRHRIKYWVGVGDHKEWYLFDRKFKKLRYYDFYVPKYKVLVEYDGGTHPSPFLSKRELSKWRCFYSGVSAKVRIKDDKRKAELAVENGCAFIRIHHDQFSEDPRGWIKKIKRFIVQQKEKQVADYIRA